MPHTHYQIVDVGGTPVVSVMDPNCSSCVNACNSESELVVSEKGNCKRRRGIKKIAEGYAFLCSENEDYLNSSKSFKRHLNFLVTMAAEYTEVKKEIASREFEKSSNLLHNLIKFNALELQELYALIPQDELVRSFREQTRMVADIVRNNPQEAAGVLLRLLKNAVSVKNEFAVYQKLYNTNPKLSIAPHYVHKVIFNVVHLFYQAMREKHLEIKIRASADRILLDYESIQVALYHLMDNAVKYSEPESQISFSFETGEFGLRIYMQMESLAIQQDEESLMYESGFSGHLATVTKTSGGGVGMGVVQALLKLNHASIKLIRGVPRTPKAKLALKVVQYATNVFVIEFPSRTLLRAAANTEAVLKESLIRPGGFRSR